MKKTAIILLTQLCCGVALIGCVGDTDNQSMVSGAYNLSYSNGLVTSPSNGIRCGSSGPESGFLDVSGSGKSLGSYVSGGVTSLVYIGQFTNPINNLGDEPCFTAPLEQKDSEYIPACSAITSNSRLEFYACVNYDNGVSRTFKAQYRVYTQDPNDPSSPPLLVLNGTVTGTGSK